MLLRSSVTFVSFLEDNIVSFIKKFTSSELTLYTSLILKKVLPCEKILLFTLSKSILLELIFKFLIKSTIKTFPSAVKKSFFYYK